MIGFAFDGFPIYGPFGYTNANDATSTIKRMITSYRTRSITVRQTLTSGQALTSSQYGPDVSSTWPLGIFLLSQHEFILFWLAQYSIFNKGSFIQDYEYVSGLGDLGKFF